MEERDVLISQDNLTLCPTCSCYIEVDARRLEDARCPFCQDGLDARRAPSPAGWLATSSTNLMLTALLGAVVFPACDDPTPPARPQVIAPVAEPTSQTDTPAHTPDVGAARRPTLNPPAQVDPAPIVEPKPTTPTKTTKTKRAKKKVKLRPRPVRQRPRPQPEYGVWAP